MRSNSEVTSRFGCDMVKRIITLSRLKRRMGCAPRQGVEPDAAARGSVIPGQVPQVYAMQLEEIKRLTERPGSPTREKVGKDAHLAVMQACQSFLLSTNN